MMYELKKLGYYKISNAAVKDETLTEAGLTLLAVLSSYRNPKTNQSFPSQEKIAKDLCVSQAFIAKTVKELVSKGYITVTKKPSKNNPSHKYSIYTFNKMDKCTLIARDTLRYISPTIDDIKNNQYVSNKAYAFYIKMKRWVNNENLEFNGVNMTFIANKSNVDTRTVKKYLPELHGKLIHVSEENKTLDIKFIVDILNANEMVKHAEYNNVDNIESEIETKIVNNINGMKDEIENGKMKSNNTKSA